MREILFRGKQTTSGEWSYGYIYSDGKKTYIAYEGEKDCIIHEVIPSTVGQYTGLIDKNGKKVFEGDIVSCSCGCPHEVIYVKEYAGTYGGGMPAFYLSDMNDGYAWIGSEEVIGNIYDNPELLEGGEGK